MTEEKAWIRVRTSPNMGEFVFYVGLLAAIVVALARIGIALESLVRILEVTK